MANFRVSGRVYIKVKKEGVSQQGLALEGSC